jgi:hypothetical protein
VGSPEAATACGVCQGAEPSGISLFALSCFFRRLYSLHSTLRGQGDGQVRRREEMRRRGQEVKPSSCLFVVCPGTAGNFVKPEVVTSC